VDVWRVRKFFGNKKLVSSIGEYQGDSARKARDVSHFASVWTTMAKLDTSACATYTWSVILIVVGATS